LRWRPERVAVEATGLGEGTGATKDKTLSAGTYSIELGVKDLTVNGKTYRYFDYAKAVRK
jgi:hypothetical protein